MPRLTVLALRAALIYLLVGFTFGVLMLANKGQPFSTQVWNLLPAHIEFVLVGWTMQLALAVAFWILPRFPGGSRGNETLARAAILLINLGVLLTAAKTIPGPGISPFLLLAGRSCEALSGLLFAWHAWGRIKPLYPPS